MSQVLATPSDAKMTEDDAEPSTEGSLPERRRARLAESVSRAQMVIVALLLSALFSCQGPAEDRVCTHMLDVLGSTDVLNCTASMVTVRERTGRLRYRAYARCVIRAETARAIIECRSNIE